MNNRHRTPICYWPFVAGFSYFRQHLLESFPTFTRIQHFLALTYLSIREARKNMGEVGNHCGTMDQTKRFTQAGYNVTAGSGWLC